jgi:YXWGXW repeat-containing protein
LVVGNYEEISMLKRKLMVPLVVALGFAAAPAMSATVEYLVVTSPPPAMPAGEEIPAPQTGMTYIPGYYDYRDGSYVWVRGHMEPERVGYVFVAPTYKDGRYYTSRWDTEEHGGARNKIRQAKNKVKDRIKNGDKDD